MNKSLRTDKKNGLIIFSLSVLIVAIYVIFQPKVSSFVFPQKRSAVLSEFKADVIKNKKVDTKFFWQFREFYYPGYFIFERDGFKRKDYLVQTNNLKTVINENYLERVFLIYRSGKLNSFEALVEADTLSKVIEDRQSGRKDIVISNSSELIYQSGNLLRIFFIKPVSVMAKTNGYFDHTNPRDARIINGYYWLSVSTVNTK